MANGHDLLLPESQSQPQHIYYYYCYLITPATTTTLITAAISYLIAVDTTANCYYKLQVLLLLVLLFIFNCYSYHPPHLRSCFTSLFISDITAKYIVDCSDVLVLLCIPSIMSITSLLRSAESSCLLPPQAE